MPPPATGQATIWLDGPNVIRVNGWAGPTTREQCADHARRNDDELTALVRRLQGRLDGHAGTAATRPRAFRRGWRIARRGLRGTRGTPRSGRAPPRIVRGTLWS
ncbi:MAG: DUF2795 domain-containing protein [Phycisphaerae bacterium]|nr:DUF2795 domain-containing protein [Phycisphaerae bacterium]